ncbi:M20 family metallopeptidase [Picrophilus oshimae]|uniref:Peptidase M20 domain-containing protein 2 n=1 Tax=Picrophilus torridus (strain ATCC 700027 / DSM 9790 / JCM 10055 / NBRC 100828 / KAW 2/3) TaxID=1122961 RepID=Q6L2H1_PICTO|nr:M20 family metallopeptidase [Picrophilus oshimae]AAT42831.1 amidohydrolase [Picrophilus oshimae DSM 9789]
MKGVNDYLLDYKDDILKLSKSIYDFAELGSSEYKSSGLISKRLEDAGFYVEMPFMNMDTAFRAEFGDGRPYIGLLAEYDALPNGHSCGHNLISAWAYGTAVILSKMINSGKIIVFGTPSEEGIGPYAGSKAIMASKGAFDDLDFVIGMHPDDRWAVGSKALADAEMEFTFIGRASHMAASPCHGINALDALVASYNAINSLRDWARNDRHIVIGMIIREGGKASNVVPDKAVLEVDIRSTSYDFLIRFVSKVKRLVKSISEGFGTKLIIRDLMPVYSEYKYNYTIDNIIEDELKKINIRPYNIDKSDEIASGSTDEANVSLRVPTGHIDVKIGNNLPGHSEEFRLAADPYNASENLIKAIRATCNAVLRIINDPEILKKVRSDFNESNKA